MANVRPFICIRPDKKYADRVAALPYDVYNRSEALEEVKKEKLSFLKVDRAETQFDNSVDMYDSRVYERARDTLNSMINDGIFITEKSKCFFIYELTMDKRAQTGLVAVSSIDDYMNGVIKKHENTREDKEQDRINHVDVCNAQTGPIFLAYRRKREIDRIIDEKKMTEPLYEFTSPDMVTHKVWVIDEEEKINHIVDNFQKIDNIYIADGHHRAASAVKVGLKRRKENESYTGEEEFNYFLSVLFPDNQLMIMPYNRVVRDLNGMTADEFLERVREKYDIVQLKRAYTPDKKGRFGMYLEGKWYMIKAHEDILSSDPVDGLDVSILQDNLLSPILGITDPRKDSRIDFIGGIRGLKELERRANSDMKVAFSMYPTSIKELFDVADADRLMPPKSTWFEPKLRSGLFIHRL